MSMIEIGSSIGLNLGITVLGNMGVGNTIGAFDLNSVVPETLYQVRIESTMEISIVKESVLRSGRISDYQHKICFGEAYVGNPYIRNRYPAVYELWQDLIYRCYNPNDRLFDYYGGLAIDVCDRWRCYEYFVADLACIEGGVLVLENPDENYAIDIKTATGYCATYDISNATIRPFKDSFVNQCLIDRSHGYRKIMNAKTINPMIAKLVSNKKRTKRKEMQKLINPPAAPMMRHSVLPPMLTIPDKPCTYVLGKGTPIEEIPMDYSNAAALAIPNLIKRDQFHRVIMDAFDIDHRLIPEGKKIMCTIVK